MPDAERDPGEIFQSDALGKRFAGFADADHIALAVSGGSDSTALMHLVARWLAGQEPPVVTVLTVDHGLRAQSRHEARQVGDWAAGEGFGHATLAWTGDKPARGLQQAARNARYDLMIGWCQDHDVRHLALAHTLDDQAETVVMRLARGSGVDGLSAMAPISDRDGILLVRPLLDLRRDELRAGLRVHDRVWLDDPSNEDASFERIRIRRLLKRLAVEGLDASKLALTARRMTDARTALDRLAADAARTTVIVTQSGFGVVDLAALRELPEDTAVRLLKSVVSTCGGHTVPVRLKRLEQLTQRVLALSFSSATLGGCRIWARQGRLLVAREHRRCGVDEIVLDPGSTQIWDRRFRVDLKKNAETALRVRALGVEGWAHMKATCANLGSIPAPIGRALLAFYQNGQVAAVPHIGYFAKPVADDHIDVRFIAADRHLAPLSAASTPETLNRLFTNTV